MMFGFIQNIGVPSLLLILVIALVVFGPGKLPDVGKALGQSIRSFKNEVTPEEETKELDEEKKSE